MVTWLQGCPESHNVSKMRQDWNIVYHPGMEQPVRRDRRGPLHLPNGQAGLEAPNPGPPKLKFEGRLKKVKTIKKVSGGSRRNFERDLPMKTRNSYFNDRRKKFTPATRKKSKARTFDTCEYGVRYVCMPVIWENRRDRGPSRTCPHARTRKVFLLHRRPDGRGLVGKALRMREFVTVILEINHEYYFLQPFDH